MLPVAVLCESSGGLITTASSGPGSNSFTCTVDTLMSSTTSSHSVAQRTYLSSRGVWSNPRTCVTKRACHHAYVSFPEVILVSADEMPICHLDCISRD